MRVSLFGCNGAVLLCTLNLFNRFFYRLANSLTFIQVPLKLGLQLVFLSGHLFHICVSTSATLSHDNVGHGPLVTLLRLASVCCFCLRAHILIGQSPCALNDLLDFLDHGLALFKCSVPFFERRFQIDNRLL